MQERRVFVRIPVGIDLTYQVKEGLTPPRLGLTEDLSLGGMRFRPLERMEAGQRISVTLDFPKQGKAILHGLVVWSREVPIQAGGYQAGVRWDDIPPADQARLNAFVVEHMRPRSSLNLSASPARGINLRRAILLSLLGFLLIMVGARLWVNQTQSQREAESLRAAAQTYEELIASLTGQPLRPVNDQTTTP